MNRPEHSVRLRIAALAALALAPVAATAQEPKAPAERFDLAMVPKDAPVVIAFRPAALLRRPDLKALYEEVTRPEEIRRVVDVAEPETIEQVTLVLLSRDLPAGGDPSEAIARAGATLVKTNKPREWKALAAAAGVPLVKSTHSGKDYFKATGDAAPGFGFYQPDDNSLVIASEANLRKLIDGDKADAPARAGWALPGLGKEAPAPILIAAIDFAWARGLVDPLLKANPEAALGLSVVGPVWEKTQGLVLSVSAVDDRLVLATEHVCSDEEGAARVARTFEALLTLGRNVAPEALRVLREQAKGDPKIAELAALGEQALKTASVDFAGDRVQVVISVKADVAKFVREAMQGR